MLNDFFQEGPLAERRAELVNGINHLVGLFRSRDLPVIWVRQEFAPDLSDAFLELRRRGIAVTITGTEGCQILPELDVRPEDRVIVKKRYSAFFGTDLEETLISLSPDRLVVAGVNTHACVRTTVIDAYQRDYRVVIATDCIASYDQEHHDVTMRYLGGKMAQLMSNAEVSSLLLSPDISTLDDLTHFLLELSFLEVPYFEGSLEGYLRALWSLIEDHSQDPVSPALVGALFWRAFATQPMPFDESWFDYDRLPPLRSKEAIGHYEYLKQTIVYQIADLRRMDQAGLLDRDPSAFWGGIDSPSGRRWYNLNLGEFLESAARGFYDHCEALDQKPSFPFSEDLASDADRPLIGRRLESQECSWADMADILSLGQLYD